MNEPENKTEEITHGIVSVTKDGRVIVEFPGPVRWIIFTPDEVRIFIEHLDASAREAEAHKPPGVAL